MRRLLVVLLLLAIAAIPAVGGTAWACSCAGAESEAARYREMAGYAQAVYVGTVLEQTHTPSSPYGQGGAHFRVRVDQALKGAVDGTERTVIDHGETCGSSIRLGPAFIPENPGGRVDSCSGVRHSVVDGEAERFLRYNGALPETGPAEWPAATAALLAGAALVGWNRLGRRCVVPA